MRRRRGRHSFKRRGRSSHRRGRSSRRRSGGAIKIGYRM